MQTSGVRIEKSSAFYTAIKTKSLANITAHCFYKKSCCYQQATVTPFASLSIDSFYFNPGFCILTQLVKFPLMIFHSVLRKCYFFNHLDIFYVERLTYMYSSISLNRRFSLPVGTKNWNIYCWMEYDISQYTKVATGRGNGKRWACWCQL